MTKGTDSGDWISLRILAGIGAMIPTIFALMVVRAQGSELLNWFGVGFVILPATVAALGWGFAISGHCAVHRSRMLYALIGGIALGAIAFLGGFVGPMIFRPEANQGPMLGLFITGPIGFVVGFWLGALYSFFRVR